MPDMTPKTRKELRARRDALTEQVAARSKEMDERAKELDGLVRELKALWLILGEDDTDGVVLSGTQERIRPVALLKGPGSGHTGFRDRVRGILKAHPDGMKPAEVRAELEQSGFVQAGKTKLALRVQNELHHLLNTQELVRKDGKYSLVGI